MSGRSGSRPRNRKPLVDPGSLLSRDILSIPFRMMPRTALPKICIALGFSEVEKLCSTRDAKSPKVSGSSNFAWIICLTV